MTARGQTFALWAIVLTCLGLLSLAVLSSNGGLNASKAVQGGDPTGRHQQKSEDAQADAPRPPSFVALFFGGDLEEAAAYCASDQQDKAKGWIVKHWCDVKRTDVVSAGSAVATVVVTAFLLGAALLQWRVVLRQAHAMERQLIAAEQAAAAAGESVRVAERSLALTQRPWIQVSAAVAGPLRVNENGIQISVDLTTLNVGQTPALDVDWDIRAVLRTQKTFDAVVQQREMARAITAQPEGRSGDLIFAKTGVRRNITFGPTSDEVRAALAAYEPHPYTMVRMYVVGSVSYRFPFNGELHQTGFIYDVMVTDDTSPIPSKLIDAAGGDIPAERLLLNIAPDGSPYID